MKRRTVAWACAFACVALLAIGALFFTDRALWALGEVLVKAESPRKAEMAAVLGGDMFGNRILKGAELVRNGYAPAVYVSGGGEIYGNHESALAIQFAVRHGEPAGIFVPLLYPALATVDEAAHLIAEFRRLKIHRVLVVTSPRHTGRAGRIFRRLAPDLEIHMIAAQDPLWNGGRWWVSREGRKLWLQEAEKSLADLIGL